MHRKQEKTISPEELKVADFEILLISFGALVRIQYEI